MAAEDYPEVREATVLGITGEKAREYLESISRYDLNTDSIDFIFDVAVDHISDGVRLLIAQGKLALDDIDRLYNLFQNQKRCFDTNLALGTEAILGSNAMIRAVAVYYEVMEQHPAKPLTN